MSDPIGFLAAAAPDTTAQEMFDEDLAELGFVMNVTRLWAHDSASMQQLFGLARHAAHTAGLSIRERLLVVLATSAARQSRYCILAWGTKFADELDLASALDVVAGTEAPRGLSDAEVALVRWCRQVAGRPRGTTASDVAALRDAGWSDRQIFALTVFAAARLAFASVNDALGVEPDSELTGGVAAPLAAAVAREAYQG